MHTSKGEIYSILRHSLNTWANICAKNTQPHNASQTRALAFHFRLALKYLGFSWTSTSPGGQTHCTSSLSFVLPSPEVPVDCFKQPLVRSLFCPTIPGGKTYAQTRTVPPLQPWRSAGALRRSRLRNTPRSHSMGSVWLSCCLRSLSELLCSTSYIILPTITGIHHGHSFLYASQRSAWSG
jgi:hypothetical protein